jgi:hypothetical protein
MATFQSLGVGFRACSARPRRRSVRTDSAYAIRRFWTRMRRPRNRGGRQPGGGSPCRRSARELRGRSRSESDRRRLARFPCMVGEIRRQLDARSARKAAPDTGVQNDGAHPAPVARASVGWQACPRAVVGLFRAEQITVSS